MLSISPIINLFFYIQISKNLLEIVLTIVSFLFEPVNPF